MNLKFMTSLIATFAFSGVLAVASSTLFSSSASARMILKSKAIKANTTIGNAQVFNSFGCTGENISPDLEWSGAPKNTKAFAVTVYDPDAPTGAGWWHWTVFNIPSTVTHLDLGAGSGKASLPAGAVEGRTDFGKPGYGGPCPPPGKPHRYIFHVYALKGDLPLDKSASGSMVGFYLHSMAIGEAHIQAKYGR